MKIDDMHVGYVIISTEISTTSLKISPYPAGKYILSFIVINCLCLGIRNLHSFLYIYRKIILDFMVESFSLTSVFYLTWRNETTFRQSQIK